MKQAVTLRLVYPDDTMFLYSVGLKTSVEGVAADIRINDKPFEDIPRKPILDGTQDDFQEVFLRRYDSWQPNEQMMGLSSATSTTHSEIV